MSTLFADGFEGGNFRKWSFVQAQSEIGPGASTNYVATADSLGIKSHGGKYVAHFERPPGSPENSKIFKEWSNDGKLDQFHRLEEQLPDGGKPEGIYKVWYYLPADYQHTNRSWTNLLQFKEEGINNGRWEQSPSWWLNMSAANAHGGVGNDPILFVNYWVADIDPSYDPVTVKVPLGRWFEIKAELHENDRIDWFLDGRKFDTSLDSTYDVGRFYDKSDGWVFGIGHYGGLGRLYVDDVSVTTLGSKGSAPEAVAWWCTPAPVRTLTGTAANETLKGTDANDKLNGCHGDDTLIGGKGHDTYVVDSAGDKVVEARAQGSDKIILTAGSYTMPKNVDNLAVSRDAGAHVAGNAEKNIITGDVGDDKLWGGWSADKLTGGGGDDTFIFRKGEAEGDIITDFDGNGAEAGDVLRFEGFGKGAELVHEGVDWTVEYDGGSDTLHLTGVSSFATGDWIFA